MTLHIIWDVNIHGLLFQFIDLYESDEAGARGSKVRSSVVQPPLPVHLSPAQVNLTRQFRRQFEELGM